MIALDMIKFPLFTKQQAKERLGHPVRPAGQKLGQRKRIKSSPQKKKKSES